MFYIRADANSEIGSGHVMRCLAIANALRNKHIESVFITADDNSVELIKSYGYQIIILHSNWKNLDEEVQKLVELISQKKIECLLIDSYFISEDYLEKIRLCTKIIYLDDINKFIYPVDILINYNIYANIKIIKEYYTQTKTKLLLGCEYAPLREEFRNKKVELKKKVTKILITTGGTDTYNMAGHILQFLNKKDEFDKVSFYIVVGSYNRHIAHLEEISKQYGNIILHRHVTEMSKLMTECDIAVSAGGTTLYELCSCAIPAISFSFADNQLDAVKEFNRQDIIYYAGDTRVDMTSCLCRIEERLKQLILDYELRKKLSERMSSLVDGLGSGRIADEIII